MTNVMTSGLSEKAYEIIKERLVGYEQGKFLSARSFASEVNMSYTPVREAFLRLQKEGFLKRVPNVGFFVVKLDIREILDIFQVRECIEPFVLDIVFDAISEKDLLEMTRLVDEQKEALKAKNIKQYIKADEHFHFIFFKIFGNNHFINIIKNVREQDMFCSNRIAKSGGMEGLYEHEQMIEQIREKNKTEAVRTMTAHIENAKQRMKEGFISEYNFGTDSGGITSLGNREA